MTGQRAPTEQLLTPAAVAALVFVDPKTVSRWARAGKIPSMRTPGGHRRFLRSDVEALIAKDWDRYPRQDAAVSAPADHADMVVATVAGPSWDGSVEGGGVPATRDTRGAAADAVVAEAVAIALEAQAELAAETVLETAASVAVAAETVAAAAEKARHARAFAAAQAAQLVAREAANSAAALRSRAEAQAASVAEAAAEAKRHVLSTGIDAETTFAAVRIAVTVQAAADTTSADTALAAARVAQAVADAAAHVAMTVAAFEVAVERETAAAAAALHRLTLETAQRVAQKSARPVTSHDASTGEAVRRGRAGDGGGCP
jgi:excisionase family DNA binding protein